MSNIDKSYNWLKTLAVHTYELNRRSCVDIKEIITLYQSQIDSNRVFSQINTIAELIQVLEKRGCLSPIDIDAFDYIFSYLHLPKLYIEDHKSLIVRNGNNCDFLKKYGEYCTNELPIAQATPLRAGRLSRSSPSNHGAGDRSCHSTLNTNKAHQSYQELPEKVINIVCSQIGKSWKSLGYQLGIQVGVVDEISEDSSITNNEQRARLILQKYQQNVEPSEMKLNLLKALKLTQRMDLHDQVQKCFLLNAM